jgi:hypothetical protein
VIAVVAGRPVLPGPGIGPLRPGEGRLTAGISAFRRVGYLAASEAEAALIKTKSGALKLKVTDEALIRVSREELEAWSWMAGRSFLSRMRLAAG